MGRRGVYTNHMTARVAVLVLFLFPAGLLAQPGGGDAGIEPEELEKSPPPEEGDKDQLKKELACEKLGNCKTPQDGGQKGDKLLEKKKPGAPKDDDQTALKKKFSKSGVVPKAKLPPAPPPDAPPGETEGVPGGLLRDVEDQAGAPVESGRDREPGSTPPEDAGITSESRARQHRSVGTAARRAENMLRGLNSAQDEPGRGAKPADRPQDQAPQRPQERTQAQAPAQIATAPANLASPKTPKDLVLAAHSGFGGSFRALGLKAGTGPGGEPAILRKDGGLATPAEVAALQARIESEPAALLRRPDFFEALPRDRFESLRRDYGGRPELRHSSFQDVGATERRRDFYWSASCDRLSGGCNPNAERASYKKGEDVSPEDLNRIWSDINKDGDEEDDSIFEEYTEAERRESEEAEALRERIGRSAFGEDAGKGLAGLLGSLGAAARSFLEGGAAPESEEPGVLIGGEREGGAFAVASKAGRKTDAARPGTAGSKSARDPQKGPPPRRPGRRFYLLGAAVLAAALIWTGARRR